MPYLLELRKDGVEIVLLTFEPDLRKQWTAEQVTEMKREMAEKGIEWHCLAYHKKLSVLATSYDILAGAMFIRRMINAGDIDILHGRVHVPTLMGAIARKLSRRKPKLLFDIRGFFQRNTPTPASGRKTVCSTVLQNVEKWLMKEADGFVVLTEKARDIVSGIFRKRQ
ncbi:MAG: glycosyltransferase [Chloracidobacterium sp.]|nr:glycosyltransferase [Chloracidobacterium sp.]